MFFVFSNRKSSNWEFFRSFLKRMKWLCEQDNDKPVLSLISSHIEKIICVLWANHSWRLLTEYLTTKTIDFQKLMIWCNNIFHQFFWLVYAFYSLIHSIVVVSFQAISPCLETNIPGCVLSHARILNHFVPGVDLLLLLLFLFSSQASTKATIDAAGN